MNRKYEFVPTTSVTKVGNSYFDLCQKNNFALIDETAKLNEAESYSCKPVYAAGLNFYGGFFVDRSAIRRPDSMPAGETWMYAAFPFQDSDEMIEQKDLVVDCLNDPYKLRYYTQVILNDSQIFNSNIELDLHGENGAWNFWYKTN